MAFKFSNEDKDIEAGIRRIAVEQAGKAVDTAREGREDPQAAIHAIRRRCKKVRALLRLVRGSFRDYRRENEVIRDASRALGQLRDRPVVLETYEKLVRETDIAVAPEEREQLIARLGKTGGDAPAEALVAFARTMDGVRQRAETWTVRKDDFGALDEGLGATYRRLRKAMAKARRQTNAENLHDWRKLAKYHGHHLGLISPAAPHVLLASRSAANELADILGRHHDLDMLSGCLDESTPLAPALASRKRLLEAEAFRIGQELAAESPEAFVARCAAYWQEWRR